MDYEAKKLYGLVSNKDFEMSDDKISYITSNPYFKNHQFKKVPISQLIRDNDLDNPVSLSNRREMWGENPIYQKQKDKNSRDVIYATLRNGTYRLANGRHRIKALQNSGYENIWIPVLEEKGI